MEPQSKTELNDYSNQLNPAEDAYCRSRGYGSKPDDDDDTRNSNNCSDENDDDWNDLSYRYEDDFSDDIN